MTPLLGSSSYGYTYRERERERETYHHIPSQKQIASSHFYYPFCFMAMLKELFELLFITVFFLLLLLQWGSMEWIMLPVSSLRNMSCYSLGMISFNSKLLCLCFPLCAVMLYAWMLFAHHWSGRGASMIINCGGPIIINATRCHFVGFHLQLTRSSSTVFTFHTDICFIDMFSPIQSVLNVFCGSGGAFWGVMKWSWWYCSGVSRVLSDRTTMMLRQQEHIQQIGHIFRRSITNSLFEQTSWMFLRQSSMRSSHSSQKKWEL